MTAGPRTDRQRPGRRSATGRARATGPPSSEAEGRRPRGAPRPARLVVAFGPTASPALPAAIRAAQAVPGYRRDSEGSRARHVVDTPLPFADPDMWRRLRAVIDTVGQWKASVVQIGGRLCWAPLARRPRAGRGPHLFPSAAGRCPGRGLLRREGDADGRRDRVGLPLRRGCTAS